MEKKFVVHLDGKRIGEGTNERNIRGAAERVSKANPGSRVELREVQESVLEIWESPPKPTKREFMVYPELGEYREITDEPAEFDPDDEGVLTTLIEEKVHNRMITTVRCDIYYDNAGVFELKITRPPEQAMAIYLAALKADDDLEAGVLKPLAPKS